MKQEQTLVLSAHDELFIIDLDRVLYLKADDHYTEVNYSSGAHFLVPFGLVKIEALVSAMPQARRHLLRLGRKYMVNTRRVFRINTVKEQLFLTLDDGSNTSLHLPKQVLRALIDTMQATGGNDGGNSGGSRGDDNGGDS